MWPVEDEVLCEQIADAGPVPRLNPAPELGYNFAWFHGLIIRQGHSGTLAQARALATAHSPGLRLAVDSLLGNGGALGSVANRFLSILSCKRLLSRSLSLDAFVLLPVTTSDVLLP